MLWKLLKQHISIAQLSGFFLANLCGMIIILFSIQCYLDLEPVLNSNDSFLKKNYLIISKKVSTLGSLVGNSGSFSPSEQEDVAEQDFVKQVGAFRPAQFKVSASVGMKGMRMSTAMFFESVPDEFVDIEMSRWKYTPSDEEIPIVIPRNYLNLYNFGFAQSRNLPQLSEGMMGMLAFDIYLSGKGQRESMKGRIVGFSNRLNTILVPESFMVWANQRFGSSTSVRPSRLIVEVDNPADERIAKYFSDRGYETEDDKLDAGKARWFLNMAVGVILSVGLLISLLSFYILMLSIYLLLQKNASKIQNLLLLGYSPARVALPYQLLTFLLNLGVCLFSAVIVWFGECYTIDYLQQMFPKIEAAGIGYILCSGCLLAVLVSLVNSLAIRRKIYTILQ